MPPLKACEADKAAHASKAAVNKKGGWFGGGGGDDVEAKTANVNCDLHTHRLIQCRAISLGCSARVKVLKQCSSDGGGECVEQQREVGKCVMDKREEMREWWLKEYKATPPNKSVEKNR